MIMASDSIKNPRKGFVFVAVAVDNNERLMPIGVGNLHTHTHRLCRKGKSQHLVSLSAITMATLDDPTQPNPDVHCAAPEFQAQFVAKLNRMDAIPSLALNQNLFAKRSFISSRRSLSICKCGIY